MKVQLVAFQMAAGDTTVGRGPTRPNASAIARDLDVSHYYVCTVARAEGVTLRPGRRYD